MVKKLLGAVCLVLALSCGAVTAFAAMDKSVPVVSNLFGHVPGQSGASTADTTGDERTLTEDDFLYIEEDESGNFWLDGVMLTEAEIDQFFEWWYENDDFAPAKRGAEVVADDDVEEGVGLGDDTGDEEFDDGFDMTITDGGEVEGQTAGGISMPGTDPSISGSRFMDSLEAIAVSDMFNNRVKYRSTTMTDPYIAHMDFEPSATFEVKETKDGIVTVTTDIVIPVDANEATIENELDKELEFAVIYEMISQALGNNVGVGSDWYRVNIGTRLIEVPATITFDAATEAIAENTKTVADVFTLEILNVVKEDYAVTAQLKFTLLQPVKQADKSDIVDAFDDGFDFGLVDGEEENETDESGEADGSSESEESDVAGLVDTQAGTASADGNKPNITTGRK